MHLPHSRANGSRWRHRPVCEVVRYFWCNNFHIVCNPPTQIKVAAWCLENNMPYLGICLGMQVAIIAYARTHCNIHANSTEFDLHTAHPIILKMNQTDRAIKIKDGANTDDLGGTLRLGLQAMDILENTSLFKIYAKSKVSERHRHRYEVNPLYHDQLINAGMVLSASSHNGLLIEAIEVPTHPWYIACQYHPEFLSTPHDSHPLFDSLVEHILANV